MNKKILLLGIISIVLAIAVSFSVNASLTDDIIWYHKLEGNLSDATGNGWTGTNRSSDFASAKIDLGSNFDASAEGVYFPNTEHILGDNFSLNFWWRCDGTGSSTRQDLFSKGDSAGGDAAIDFLVDYNELDEIRARFTGGGVNYLVRDYETDPECNIWYMTTITFEKGATDGLKIYTNGDFKNSTTVSNTLDTADIIHYGQYGGNSAYGLKGELDEAGLWNRTLTPAEITELYNNATGLQYPFSFPTNYIDITHTPSTVTINCTNGTTSSYNTSDTSPFATIFEEGDTINCTVNATNYWSNTYENKNADFNVTLIQYPLINLYNEWDSSQLSNFTVEINGTNYTTTGSDLYVPYNATFNVTTYKTDWISETHEIALTPEETHNISIHQSEIVFQPKEIYTGNNINSANCYLNGTNQSCATSFNITSGTYNVTVSHADYYNKQYEFTVDPLDQKTINVNDTYSTIINLNLTDAITNNLLTVNTFLNMTLLSSTYELNNTNGTYTIQALNNQNYSFTGWGTNYAYSYLNLSVENSTYQSQNVSMYARNSIWIYARNLGTGSELQNFTVNIFSINTTYTGDDNNTGVARFDNITSGTYTVEVDKDNFTKATYTVTVNGGSHQKLTAYLISDVQQVVFTMVNSISGSIIEGVTVSMFKQINSTWTLINSLQSDITGRVQFNYEDETTYKFTGEKTGYELKDFLLEPLFTTYTVTMTPETSQTVDDIGGDYYVTINPFDYYDEQINNMTFTITSSQGTLEYYNISIIAPNVNQNYNYTNAIGGTHDFSLNISGAVIGDVVTINYTVKESGYSPNTFTRIYSIMNVAEETTLRDWENANTGLGQYGKSFLATILIIIVVGIIATGTSLVGMDPLIPSALAFLGMIGLFASIGFVPTWSLWIGGVALGIILLFSVRNY